MPLGIRLEGCIPCFGRLRNCYIGAKAIIIGDVFIGDNCKIGAGSVVTKNIPPNCTVVGVPAKVIKINGKRV